MTKADIATTADGRGPKASASTGTQTNGNAQTAREAAQANEVVNVTGEMEKLEVQEQYEPRYIDVGINLTDQQYDGYYNSSKKHERDLEDVIDRSLAVGCSKLMVTGSSLKDSQRAVELAKSYPGTIYATVGVHPCLAHTLESHPDDIHTLESLARAGLAAGHVTAFGEIGLDYDRLFRSKKEPQLRQFAAQLRLAERLDLPLFLHSRAASEDFERLLFAANLPKKGLVHSFTGSVEEMLRLVKAGYDIGVNGCSLKTEENLECVRQIPLERLQLETDGPWCEIRPSHASAVHLETMPKWLQEGQVKAMKKEKWEKGLRVKGRNEPCAISEVAWVVAQVKGLEFEVVCETSWANSMRMFGFDEADKKREAAGAGIAVADIGDAADTNTADSVAQV